MRPMDRGAILTAVVLALTLRFSAAQDGPDYDLRDIRVGMLVANIPDVGYVNLICANDPNRKLRQWSDWRECPADVDALHAIRFGFDVETSRDGTLVAGHPVILTALIDSAGIVAGLKIDTDPQARFYMRKKAFLLGLQVKSRYGSEGWTCTQRQPQAGEQPLGGVYLRENCTKSSEGRMLVVQRDLFRRVDQDSKNFVDQTQVTIMRAKSK
jgi:hypothetical protein